MIINSPKETLELAKDIANNSKIGDVICLRGTLGAGKSFFARSFINHLQKEPTEVLSPTFNLVYSYQTRLGEVYHFDLYRLKSPEELENIGFFDAIKNGICLIEWPELALQYLRNYIEISIKIIDEEKRELEIKNF